MRSVRWSCLTERRLTLIRLRGAPPCPRKRGKVRPQPQPARNCDHDEDNRRGHRPLQPGVPGAGRHPPRGHHCPRLRHGERPASPDGTRYEGYDASFSSWEALIDDTTSHFEVEDVHTGDEWALIRWSYVWGPGPDDSVRGVNVMRVVDGKIVEAAGYSKTAPIAAALES
jgi:hypothetical protein